MNPMKGERDPDIRGSWPALLRASRKARELSIATGTPFYVVRDGRLVDLNAKRKTKPKRTKRRRS